MRKIKFRAWDKEQKKMLSPIDCEEFTLHNIDDWNGGDHMDFMQYVGFPDKNGKEIFEGDRVKFHTFTRELGESLGVVEGEKEIIVEISIQQGSVWLQGDTEEDSGYLLLFEGTHEESFEVIGNIYE